LGGQLNPFRQDASIHAILCSHWYSKRVRGFRILGNLHLRTAHHFSAFPFRHQLQPFLRLVALIAGICRNWTSNAVLNFRVLATLHFPIVRHFDRFAFLRQLK
jgi:hypothetical protein